MIGRGGGGREMEEQRRVKSDWERGRGEGDGGTEEGDE